MVCKKRKKLEFKTVSVDGLGSGMGKMVRALDKADAMLTLSNAV